MTNLLPIANHSWKEYLTGTKSMTLSLLGFEYLLIYYPFIKKAKESQKWAHFGNMSTVLIYLITAFSTTVFFSSKQLQTVVWPTLSEWKIVKFPFVERFEYIGITFFGLIIVPNLALAFWGFSRVIKRTCHIKQTYMLWVGLITAFVATLFFETREEVDKLNTFVSEVGFYLIYGYIPFLFFIVFIRKKVWEK
ncbi:hypothetical protein JOC83_000861 [Bacillus iocasae]|uniref:Uncharacterized protein n=1 Tax=Priestia iocasae TaxID=2291674 RepID=A0ABS2QRK6_9BACI|nr:hypothetical protein [Metabacillus iocasae]